MKKMHGLKSKNSDNTITEVIIQHARLPVPHISNLLNVRPMSLSGILYQKAQAYSCIRFSVRHCTFDL